MAKKPNQAALEAIAASRPQPPSQSLTDEERGELRTYVARRVTELRREAESGLGFDGAARMAKGEWMLALYEAQGNRVGAALLAEVIADCYGVPR